MKKVFTKIGKTWIYLVITYFAFLALFNFFIGFLAKSSEIHISGFDYHSTLES